MFTPQFCGIYGLPRQEGESRLSCGAVQKEGLKLLENIAKPLIFVVETALPSKRRSDKNGRKPNKILDIP